MGRRWARGAALVELFRKIEATAVDDDEAPELPALPGRIVKIGYSPRTDRGRFRGACASACFNVEALWLLVCVVARRVMGEPACGSFSVRLELYFKGPAKSLE